MNYIDVFHVQFEVHDVNLYTKRSDLIFKVAMTKRRYLLCINLFVNPNCITNCK